MITLENILEILRENQSKAARFLGLNRGSVRSKLDDSTSLIIVDNVVYKKVSKVDLDQLDDYEKAAYRQHVMRVSGETYCPHCCNTISVNDTTCVSCGEGV